MTKQELISSISEKTGLKKVESEKALNAVLETISETLKSGEKVQLIGFGTFETRTRAARTGRNPQTGAEIQIPESVLPAFKPGTGLKESLKK